MALKSEGNEAGEAAAGINREGRKKMKNEARKMKSERRRGGEGGIRRRRGSESISGKNR